MKATWAPKTRQSAAGFFIPLGDETAPLGQRFIEVPYGSYKTTGSAHYRASP